MVRRNETAEVYLVNLTLLPTQVDALPSEIPSEAQKLLVEYPDVFPADLHPDLPPERTVDHKIELLPGAASPDRPIISTSQQELDPLWEQLDDLLSKGFIRLSVSPFGSLVFYVKKKDGTLR
jgi:hypothetical protein